MDSNISSIIIESNERSKMWKYKINFNLDNKKYINTEFNKDLFKTTLKFLFKKKFEKLEYLSNYKNDEEDLFLNYDKENLKPYYFGNEFSKALFIVSEKELLIKRLFEYNKLNKNHIYGIWLFNGLEWKLNIMDDLFLSLDNYSIKGKTEKLSYLLFLEKAFIQCFQEKLLNFRTLDFWKAIIGIEYSMLNLNKTSNDDLNTYLIKNNKNLIILRKNNKFSSLKDINFEENLIKFENEKVLKFDELKNKFSDIIIFDTFIYYFNKFELNKEINYYKLFVYETSKINFEILSNNKNIKILLSQIIDNENFKIIYYLNYEKNKFYNLDKGEYLLIIKNNIEIKLNEEIKYIATSPIDIQHIYYEKNIYGEFLIYLFQIYLKNNNVNFNWINIDKKFKFSIEKKFIKEFNLFIYKIESKNNNKKCIKFKTKDCKNINIYPLIKNNIKKTLKLFCNLNNNFNIFLVEIINKEKKFNIDLDFYGIKYFDNNEEFFKNKLDYNILKEIFWLKKIKSKNHFTFYNNIEEDVGCSGCKIF